jgi:hypothetical protein
MLQIWAAVNYAVLDYIYVQYTSLAVHLKSAKFGVIYSFVKFLRKFPAKEIDPVFYAGALFGVLPEIQEPFGIDRLSPASPAR